MFSYSSSSIVDTRSRTVSNGVNTAWKYIWVNKHNLTNVQPKRSLT